MSRIIASTRAQDDADHVPMFVDNNPQVPSRIKALIEGTGEDPAPVLVKMARGLEAQGAEALAMPCNTAHHYANQIRGAVTIPFIDMVGLSRAKIVSQTPPGARIGMLASPAVRIVGIFDKALEGSGRIPLDQAYQKVRCGPASARGNGPDLRGHAATRGGPAGGRLLRTFARCRCRACGCRVY
jgi:aspartate racemase